MLDVLGRGAIALGLAAAMLTATTPAHAAPDGVDERADRLLREMSEYLAAATSMTFRADVQVDHVLANGQKLEFFRRAEIWVRRPDRLYADVDGDLERERYWYNGRQVSFVNRNDNSHVVLDAPDNLDAMLDFLAAEHDVSTPVADFIYSRPYDVLTQHVREGQYIGLHEVRGKRAHHLAFRQTHVDWQIWISDGPAPVPRKLVITYKKVPSTPGFRVVLYDWDFDTRLPDVVFEYIAPDGARAE